MKRKRIARTGGREELLQELSGGKAAKNHTILRRVFRGFGLTIGICILLLSLAFLIVQAVPGLGAQGADLLRHICGDKAVAGLEMQFNRLQDGLQKFRYKLVRETAAAPWEIPSTPAPPVTLSAISNSTPVFKTTAIPRLTASPAAANTPQLTSTPAAILWHPSDLVSMGGTNGEGVWSVYLLDTQGREVGYRTFLQPDPERPYTLVAIVAVDLERTRLHFVLGSNDPAGEPQQRRSGAIPQIDRIPGVLLAAFNGGFQARHGKFGAMADGIVALPPREGLGTLVINKSGRVSLGEWEVGMTLTPNVTAFRQNGPLVIQAGQINPRIHNNSPQDWGYTVNDVSPTVRTGLGLSKDNQTLYYFCGPSLNMEMLAKTMQNAGAWNAIQLDINNYWALFVKFQPKGSAFLPEPLLPRLMVDNVERYLWEYTRDYFYITSVDR
jgi:hypothetical protein